MSLNPDGTRSFNDNINNSFHEAFKNRIVSRGICYYITANGRHTFHVSYIIAQLTRECHRVGVDLFVFNCYTTYV